MPPISLFDCIVKSAKCDLVNGEAILTLIISLEQAMAVKSDLQMLAQTSHRVDVEMTAKQKGVFDDLVDDIRSGRVSVTKGD